MKKISTNLYADAFVAALEKGGTKASVVEKFIETIKHHNDWARRKQILDACEKRWRRIQGKSLVTIESARELTKDQREKLAEQWKDKHHDIEYAINPSLIAGAKIIINEERQLDGSLNNKLRKIFAES